LTLLPPNSGVFDVFALAAKLQKILPEYFVFARFIFHLYFLTKNKRCAENKRLASFVED
jgi:hypothetical protein